MRTRPVDDPGGLLDLFPDEHPLCWVRDGEGLVGWGEVARFTASGPERFAAADHWWRSFAAELGAVLLLSEDMLRLGSTGIMSLKFPEHQFTKAVAELAARIVGRTS